MKKELSKECTEYLQKHADLHPANEWGSFEQWISHLFINIEDFSKGDLRGSLYELQMIMHPNDAVNFAIEFIRYHLNEE